MEESSAHYLEGVEIDFKEEGLSGGFTIDNPNAIASCGCGSSFKMKDEEGQVENCDH
ncbi:Iron-binding protein IscA [compost metagenome]